MSVDRETGIDGSYESFVEKMEGDEEVVNAFIVKNIDEVTNILLAGDAKSRAMYADQFAKLWDYYLQSSYEAYCNEERE